MAWKSSRQWPKSLESCTHMRNPEKAPGFGSASVLVSQHMEDLSLSSFFKKLKWRTFILWQREKPPLLTAASHQEAQASVPAALLLIQLSAGLLVKATENGPSSGALWETWMKFQAPEFHLTQPRKLKPAKSKPTDSISLSLSLLHSLLLFQIKNKSLKKFGKKIEGANHCGMAGKAPTGTTWASVHVPAASFSIQFPAKDLGKAAKNGYVSGSLLCMWET